MQLDSAVYDLTQEAGGAIFMAMRAAQAGEQTVLPALLQLRRGYAESPAWLLVQATEFAPAPLTLAGLRVRHTYGSERLFVALLELMASEGWFDRDDAGAYHLTRAGRTQADQLRPRQHAQIAALAPPPGLDVVRLSELLGRVVVACLRAPDPPGSWCLAHSRRRAPAADVSPLAQIFQYSEDLNAFRDDAHMAGWRPCGLDGRGWEALALLCAGQAADADALFERLAYRGHSRAEYAATLAALAARGWAEPTDLGAGYRPTAAGLAAWAEAERRTDAAFYGPWACLDESEIAELHSLLRALVEQFQF